MGDRAQETTKRWARVSRPRPGSDRRSPRRRHGTGGALGRPAVAAAGSGDPAEPRDEPLKAILSDWPIARPADWVRLVNQPVTDKEAADIRTSIARNRPFGSQPAYLELMAQWCREEGVDVWGYCLMPNHVHLIAVPRSEHGLRRAIGEAHRRYTRRINFREKWRGYLWQGRFASFVMDEPYLLAAARYVELNPVRAGLVADAADWPWSSARAHLSGRDDRLVQVAPLLAMLGDWRALLDSALPEEELRELR